MTNNYWKFLIYSSPHVISGITLLLSLNIYSETASALLAEYFVISDRELKTRYVPSSFYFYLTTRGRTSMFEVVERGFPIVLFSENKTAFSYYGLLYFCHDNKEPNKYVRIYPSVRNYTGLLYIPGSQTALFSCQNNV